METNQPNEKPSDAQKNFLAKLGVSAADANKMTKQEASAKIDELTHKNSAGSGNAWKPPEPVKIATLEGLLVISDTVRQHILDSPQYKDLTEIGQMRTWEVILNNYIKGKITEGISSQKRGGR